MRKTALTLSLISSMLFSVISGAVLVNVANANFVVYLPYIVINEDGSVTPETEFIQHTGNVYTLTGDLSQEYAVKIKCSNIVFDGRGNTINGTVTTCRLGSANIGLRLDGVTNVTVKNVEVIGFWDVFGFMDNDVSLENCYECMILRVRANGFELADSNSNTIFESNIGMNGHHLLMRFSNNNKIFRNSINSIDVVGCSSNIFSANNFLGNHRIVNKFLDLGIMVQLVTTGAIIQLSILTLQRLAVQELATPHT